MSVRAICAVSLMWFLLGGCFDHQESQVAKCQLETEDAGINPRSMGIGKGWEHMELCMKAAGYKMNISPKACQPTLATPLWLDAYCYEPSDPMEKWLYRIEMAARSQ